MIRHSFRKSPSSSLALAASAALLATSASAADFTLAATDPGGTSSFTNPLTGATPGWPGAPIAGNNYIVGGGASAVGLRGPTTGAAFTFPGDLLTLLTNGRFLFKTAPTTAQTLNVANLTLNGGVLDLATSANDGAAANFAGAIALGPNSASGGVGALTGETFTISASISGANPLIVAGPTVNAGASTGTVVFTGANTNTGGATVNFGRVLLGSSNATTVSGPLGASTGDVTLGPLTGANAASILTNGAFTFSNSLIVRAGGTGLLSFGGNTAESSTFSGNVTLGKDVTLVQPFGGTINFTGNVTSGAAGTQILNFNNTGDVMQTAGVIGGGTGAVSISQNGPGTTTLTGSNVFKGLVAIFAGGKISVSSLNSVVGGTASSNLGAPVTALAGTIRLGGSSAPGTVIYTGSGETTDRSIDLSANSVGSNGVLEQSGTGLLKFTSGVSPSAAFSPKTLTLQGSTAGAGEISGAIANGTGTATTAITKSGTGTWTLSGPNTYTGDTIVYDGMLVLKSPALAATSNVSVFFPATLKLDYVGTATVKTLYLDGVQQPDGIYGSSDPSGLLTGTGKIQVGSAGYATWAAANAGGQDPDGDFDNDGVRNGIEFFTGQTGTSFSSSPVIVGNALSFPKSATFTGTYHFQTSPDLAIWTDATTGITDDGTTVTFAVPNVPGKQFVRLKVEPQ
jgi:autotransporter-associated beta strand protein